jgi:hypothetical protein
MSIAPLKAPFGPGLIRIAILAAVIAVIAACVALCAPSNYSSNSGSDGKASSSAPSTAPSTTPPSSASSAAPAPTPVGKDYVEGLVESISGDSIQLTTRSGSATVGLTPSTRVVEVSPAQLTNVTPGSCVNVRATPQSAPAGAAITAQSVTITPATGGTCPPPAGLYGMVTSVSGDSIVVNSAGAGDHTTPTTVTVTNATTYSKQAISSTHAIQHGKCIGAQGTNSGGALQAATISIEECPPMGRPHHGPHLPRLPRLPHIHH